MTANHQLHDDLGEPLGVLQRLGRVGYWAGEGAQRRMVMPDASLALLSAIVGDPDGVPQALEQVLGAAARAHWLAAFDQALAARQAFSIELELARLDGGSAWIVVHGEPTPPSHTTPRIVGTFRDITAQRLSAQTLTRQRDVMKTIIDNFPGAISLCDADLRMTAHNDQFMTLLGFPPALFAQGWAQLEDLARFNAERGEYGPGDPQDHVSAIVLRARNAQAHHMERQRPNGQWLEVRGMPIPSGGFVTSYVDITERKQAEQFEQFRSHILELLAKGDTLHNILEAIVRGIEQIHPAMRCSITLLDGDATQLALRVAPSLSDALNTVFEGRDADLVVLANGGAALRGERVIVDDVAKHPAWAPFLEPAASAGLGACWSQPIRSSVDQVLGTFSIYHRCAKAPAPVELYLMEQTARLASIAIDRNAVVEKLRQSEAHYRLLTEGVADVVWRTDAGNRFTYISPADQRLRGYTADEVIGHHVFEMFNDAGVAMIKEKMRERAERERAGIRTDLVTFEAQHLCKGDRVVWVEVYSTPERDAQGAIAGFHGVNRDITQRKHLEDQIRELAFYDALTKLANRRLLNDRFSQLLAANRRGAGHGALMVLDLDNFKSLNDTHGHGVGDLLLMEAARRLSSCVREVDTVARFGGDEFVVVLSDLSTEQAESLAQAGLIAEKIRVALSAPYRLATDAHAGASRVVEHRCSASSGVAMFGGEDADQASLFKWADAAMYQAKAAGRDAVRFHDALVA